MPVRALKNICSVISNWQHFRIRAGPSLKCDRRRTALSPLLKVPGNPGMLLQASASGHGGSYSLSKSLKWKRNVTGDFKANGFFHWLKHLPKTVRAPFFSTRYQAYVNVYMITRTAPAASSCNTERTGETDRTSDQQRESTAFSDILLSIMYYALLPNWVKSRGRHTYFSDLRHSQPLAVNHKATCCQLCVVT